MRLRNLRFFSDFLKILHLLTKSIYFFLKWGHNKKWATQVHVQFCLSINILKASAAVLRLLFSEHLPNHHQTHIKSRALKKPLLSPCSGVLLEKLSVFRLVENFPAFYGTRKFITAFTSAQIKLRDFATKYAYGKELLAPRPTTNVEDHHLSAVRDCLLDLFAATFHIGGRSFTRNLRTRHTVVTGTHLSWKKAVQTILHTYGR